MSDSTPLAFFESISNLKLQVGRITGRTPSTGVARDIAVCLQQGRLFFQAAEHNPMEIRPLLLFYGTMALAKAIVVIRTAKPLATLPQRHGLTDVSAPVAQIPNLAVKIETSGTFQRFNDVVAKTNSLKYFDVAGMPKSIELPAASTESVVGLSLSLKDILSRIPGLNHLYAKTFDEPALTERIDLHSSRFWADGFWELQIDDSQIFTNRTELAAIIARWRKRFPALKKWRVIRAVSAQGKSIIIFGNVPIPDDELGSTVLMEAGNEFNSDNDVQNDATIAKTPLAHALSAPGGSFSSNTSLISPFGDVYISESALHYLGMYLLSSLVRYRPQTWVHAVTRSIAPRIPADDQALALLEAFMTIHPAMMTGLTSELLGVET